MSKLARALLPLSLATVPVAADQPTPTSEVSRAARPDKSGYADVNGLRLYYAVFGKGKPLVLLHGGLGHSETMTDVTRRLAVKRQVIVADLQAHGRTADVDRPMRYESMADDVAALVSHLGLESVDLMGYSLGGGVAARIAIQHPQLVDRLVLVAMPFKRSGWYPEILVGMAQMNASAAESMKGSPMHESYLAIAPRPDEFPRLLDKIGDLMRQDYDWSAEIAKITAPTLLAYGDHDAVPPSHMAEFFALLGGGQRDAGWDGAGMSRSRLAVLPGLTHYNVFLSPRLADVAESFLDGGEQAPRWGEVPAPR